MKMNVKKIATMGVLAALSIVIMLPTRFPILPAAPYLKYDPADIPMLICAFLFGPIAGFAVTVVEATLQTLLFAEGGLYGWLMHIIASGAFVLIAGIIYKNKHDRKGALIGLVCGTLAMTLVMIPANLVITPIYTGTKVEDVANILLPAIIPFNLIKAGLNSIITFIVYKSISKVVNKI
ncbi:MAG TPA: ECF transporter S component [Clostridia bacterium]|nr:ECF transporter S component [Clostridia bacterium]